MWFEHQNCAMMGLQATTGVAGKRKLEAATAPGESTPAKNGRWEADDCIARLQAVAVPAADTWRSPTPSLTATLLTTDDDFDDDEFDDELSDEERCIVPEPVRFIQTSNYRYQDYWQYYQPPQQQTIRCEENGKSYLELGASPVLRRPSTPQSPTPPALMVPSSQQHHLQQQQQQQLSLPLSSATTSGRCCDDRTRWCHVPCYRQRRLAVLNLSMCKLARYRQCSDPSLRRSVLICNTLRRLEREMEAEPPPPPPTVSTSPMPDTLTYHPANSTNSNSSVINTGLPELAPPSRPNPVPESSYEQSLREMTCPSGRATPFPTPPPNDTDSGLGDDEMTRPINWGSVLSLTSQTDLESLNNNELYAELGLSSEPMNDWKDPSTSSGRDDWDGFMHHVLVGGT